MVEAPDRIRHEIDATRAELTHDVDRLADRTSPRRIARRRWSTVRDRFGAVSEKLMGAPSNGASKVRSRAESAAVTAQDLAHRAGDKASYAASEVAEQAREAPERLRRRTQGSPTAVGLIAFGAGMLAASVIPVSRAEERLGGSVKRQAEGLAEQLRGPAAESARQVRDEAVESAREAAQQVSETAKEAAQTTAEHARSSARQAVDHTKRNT